MRRLTVAALQLAAHDREQFSSAWSAICERVESAAHAGAQLVVLPEGTIPAYVLGEAPLDIAAVDRAVHELQELGRRLRIVIVCGTARAANGRTYNSAVVIDNGSIAGYADKCFLWHFDRRWFAPGERIAPIQTSIASLGVLICADGRMPAIPRTLTDLGADLLVMPTAWVTSGRDPHALENIQADLLAPLRAWENCRPFVAANKCGTERDCLAYCGKSQIVDAQGHRLQTAGEREPQTIMAEVHLDPASRPRITLENLERCAAPPAPLRVAITPEAASAWTWEAARLVEAKHVVARDASAPVPGNPGIASARIDDSVIADPGGLIPYRLAGYNLVVWNARSCESGWIEPLARGRAVELRIFVVVIDERTQRAFAVDPDGAIAGGTFGNFRLASFAFDPARTQQTLVAPATDIADGLARVGEITRCGV